MASFMETERESDIGYIYRVSGPRKFSQFRKELTALLDTFRVCLVVA
jgi:hypothetical protein